ncbi:PQQ-binding-like beta-propeller repeat protein [Chloroflexus sp. Y-396-1]|uniref:beta-alanine-activating enzyme beta-propeller domain-containing protein n=1 Tax=Chloroflexus sp. Y-396-1 TaxID=867845 RepID=UPI0004912964|nr:PQQ-binding-like beta-propeller repeat protein [Chloroflexus sp. Y-396-1]
MGLIKRVSTKAINTQPPDVGAPAEEGTRQISPTAHPAADEGTRQIEARPGGQSAPVAPTMLSPGTILQGRYQVEAPIGIGGMSVVYRGRDLRFKDVVRYCAIKEMVQSAPDSQTRLLNLKNFQREAGLLATLQHPAIPKVYDFFEENGKVYLVLEFIPGKDLETVLEEHGKPLDEERVARWALQICDVLSYLHNHKPEPIVFRDMKPSNVMVVGDDRIVLIDFGIARTLNRSDRKGTMIGTEGYSPPEQYRGIAEPVGDIYAFGATLHHLLTNTDPRLETPFTFQERPIRQINPTVSPEMEAVVARALEYDMAARWQSAEELRQALLKVPSLAGTSTAKTTVAVPAVLKGAQTTELVWRFKFEDEVRSSPFVSGGLVFVGCYDTNIYALDATRGEFRWKYATEGGISSSPTVWQDMVYIGSEDGTLYALDMRRGGVRWTFRTGKPIRSSPRIEDRVVFVGSDDQHIYAIDGLRGTLIWKYRTWSPIRSSACISGNSIFIGGDDGNVYCLDARTGAVKWKQRTQQPVRSSPAYSDGLVFVGSLDQNLYALDAEGGWPAWRFRTGHYINSSPCVVGTRVFIGGVDGIMYALDTKSGRLVWKYEVGSQITSSPRVEGGRLYFGAVDQAVYCLDAGNGQLIWKYPTEGAIVSTPMIVNGVVYIGSMDHHLYALKA